MKKCKECGHKIKLEKNLKSLLNRQGKVECSNCNSTFKVKRTFFREIISFIIILVGISISETIGGPKGLIIATIIMAITVLFELYIDSRYILIKEN